MNKLRALARVLTRPNDNLWLALLVAVIAASGLLLILFRLTNFFNEVLK